MPDPVPFERFMHRALYDQEHGYYARRIRGIGRRGDFTTVPMLSDVLAKAIAEWAVRVLMETNCRDLVEIGPGEGTLAAAIIKHLPWRIRWRTRLHLVETSAQLAGLQRKLLGKRAQYHESPAAALASCHGKAVIFSNELVDAFPVQRFQNTADGWRELAVDIDPDGKIRESLMPAGALPRSSSFTSNHPLGQWIEVHDAYRRWLGDWLPYWKAGRMLTIDYGATVDNLYHRHPHGTLRAYLFQQRLEGPDIYQNIGRQDLTADVNFTDLMDWSRGYAEVVKLQTLASFLQPSLAPGIPLDTELAHEFGAGGAFLVLDQKCQTGKSARNDLLI